MNKRNRVAAAATLLVAGMLGLSFAAVPLYDWFCRVTGYGGTTGVASAEDRDVIDQTIRIRFDAGIDREMDWKFTAPEPRTVELPIGETGLAFYEAHNPTDRPIAGSASYNVAPFSTGEFFVKIDCFCFEEQVLMPGETVQMPVTFYVDPDITGHREARFVNEITLSYTFYEIEMPEEEVSLLDEGQQTNPAD